MNNERWKDLMANDKLYLTVEELQEYWHFCPDWDGLLINPDMGEWKACCCEMVNKPKCREVLEPDDNYIY